MALMFGSLASCTSDEPAQRIDSTQSGLLVKAPKIRAWSGEEVFGNTKGTRAADIESPADITPLEIEAAKAYFNSKDNWYPGEGEDVEISDLSAWKNYYVQYVVEGNEIPKEVAQFVGTNREEVTEIAVWSMDADEVIKVLNTDAYLTSDAKVLIEEDGQLVTGHPLKDISFETTGYDINNTLYENIRSAGHKGQYDFTPNYRIAKLDGQEGVYVALYGYTNQNNGYWDRIIKLTKVDIQEENPGDVTDAENPEVGEGGDDNNTEVLPQPYRHRNEVEVNLSVLDLHDQYSVEDLATKLSLHVRYGKDVRVRIPVPTEILVPADDLAIVVSHPELLESYGKENKAEFMIGDNPVSVAVSFEKCVDCSGHELGSEIVVTTQGINQDVIDYCIKTNQDGINFEIFNYYQWNTTNEYGEVLRKKPTNDDINDLKVNWLNLSTVEFGYDNGTWNAYTNIVDCPYYFINAFNKDPKQAFDVQNGADCYVRVIKNQDYFDDEDRILENMPHLNGSNWNIIYVRNDIYGTDKHDDAHRENRTSGAI